MAFWMNRATQPLGLAPGILWWLFLRLLSHVLLLNMCEGRVGRWVSVRQAVNLKQGSLSPRLLSVF